MLLSSGGFEKATAPDIFKAVAFLSVENFIKNFPQFILKRKANTLDKYMGTSKNSVRFLEVPDEFQFKSLYCNDLN